MRARLAVHMERYAILGELQCQGSDGACLIDVGYLEVARLGGSVRTNVQRYPLLFAVQEEGHLVLQHREVDHEECFYGYVQLSTRSN